MTNKVKLLILFGGALTSFSYCLTSPIIQIYFIKLINAEILAMATILSTGLAAIVNATIQSDKIKDFYRKHFIWIILMDVVCFFLIGFEGLAYPEVRFLGMAVLNAISATLWMVVMKDAVNHNIKGSELTKWDSLSKTTDLASALCGSVLALFFTNIDIEYCIGFQCATNAIMGVTDWISYQKIKY